MTNVEADKLGIRIGGSTGSISSEDLQKLQEFRSTFQKPIADVFRFLLNTAREIDGRSIVTYRIKRIDTIIEKLQRFFNNANGKMRLSRMWDIAGCRCILADPDPSKLYQVLEAVKQKYGEDCKVNDYVAAPRASGYRSIHIYVKDPETGKPVEIQIRNRKLHNWSTLVEIIDVIFGCAVKEHGADGTLGRFLYLYSRKSEMTDEEFSEMLTIEKEMKIFEKMSDTITNNYLNVKTQWLTQQSLGSYFVIEANKEKSVIESYDNFADAEKVYYYKYINHKDCNIVLTHIPNPSFEEISIAYSNYVLSMHAFFDEYRSFVCTKILEQINDEEYYSMIQRDFANYLNNLKYHLKNLQQEQESVANAKEAGTVISAEQQEQWEREVEDKKIKWKKEVGDFIVSLIMTSEKDLFSDPFINDQLRSINQMVNGI